MKSKQVYLKHSLPSILREFDCFEIRVQSYLTLENWQHWEAEALPMLKGQMTGGGYKDTLNLEFILHKGIISSVLQSSAGVALT